jgi:methionine synthase I (cobalamin-dependent)
VYEVKLFQDQEHLKRSEAFMLPEVDVQSHPGGLQFESAPRLTQIEEEYVMSGLRILETASYSGHSTILAQSLIAHLACLCRRT